MKAAVALPTEGIDVSMPAEFISPRAASASQNMDVLRALLTKRLGTDALGASLAERVMAFIELQIGSNTFVLRIGLTKIELLDQGTGTWSDISGGTPLTGGATDRISWAFPFLSAAKILTFTNGIDPVKKYTGTGNVANLGGLGTVRARHQVAYQDYLLIAYIIDGGNTFASRVKWPDTGAPETWSGGNAGEVDLIDDGKDITGLGLAGDFATVHKEDSIYLGYKVDTDDIFRFDRKNTGVGAITGATIRTLANGHQIFLARDGLRLFDGITAAYIRGRIIEELRDSMNPASLSKAWAEMRPERDEYWLGVAIGSQSDPDTVYKYNYRTGECHKDLRTGITAVGRYQKTNQVTIDSMTNTIDSYSDRFDDVTLASQHRTMLYGSSAGVTTQQGTGYGDNGAAIDAYWDSKDFTCLDITGRKQDIDRLVEWTEMPFLAKGNSVTISYSTDGGITWTTIGTYNLSGDFPAAGSPLVAYFHVVAARIRFRFANSTLNESVSVKAFTPIGEPVEEDR